MASAALPLNSGEDEIDRVVVELMRLADELRAADPPVAQLTWGVVAADPTLASVFGERLSAVMSAAKAQRAVAFDTVRLVRGGLHDAVVVRVLDSAQRLSSPATANAARQRQAERLVAQRDEQKKAADAHLARVRALGAARLTAAPVGGGVVVEEEIVEEVVYVDEEEDGGAPPPPPPPPPPEGEDDDGWAPPPPPPEDSWVPPPPPPPEDEDDVPPPPPPPPE